MSIKELQKTWEAFGQSNSFWSILTNTGNWDTEEFFRLGQVDIDGIMNYVNSLNVALRRNRALDFGCGAGRLTQALCQYFEHCVGVDIAPSMIAAAEQYNRFKDKCHYYVNEASDLKLFESHHFDFIYTTLVLQHVGPELSKSYIAEFIRLLTPGGLAIFHLPAEPVTIGNAARVGRVAATGPLPESAFQAQIRVLNPPSQMKPASQMILNVEITNLGDVTWPSVGLDGHKYNVKVGNHWRNKNGEMLLNDDGRGSLPHDVKPGQTVEVPLPITAPKLDGHYILEIDAVQEAYAWFNQMGSETVKIPIKNGRPELSSAAKLLNPEAARADFTPRMEMHGVPKAEVIACVEQAGGKIVDIVDDTSAGNEWVCYRYCATK